MELCSFLELFSILCCFLLSLQPENVIFSVFFSDPEMVEASGSGSVKVEIFVGGKRYTPAMENEPKAVNEAQR